MRHTPPVFRADSVTKSFGTRQVLKSATAWAIPGSITVMFGRNGCGKSTLLKVATGMLRGDQGVIHYDGRAYLRPRLPVLARRGLFYLPDSGLLSRRLSIREQLHAVQWRFGAERCAATLERLGIAHVTEQNSVEVSGGEATRAALAIALMREPRCLLADEPFAGINPSDAEVIAAALRELAARGCAILVTGHEVRQLLDVADEVIWMVAGTTHGLGSTREAQAHHQFRREYLGF